MVVNDVELFRTGYGKSLYASYGASNCCLRRQPDHRTILEVDESLFWLQTSVQAILAKAMGHKPQQFMEIKYFGTYSNAKRHSNCYKRQTRIIACSICAPHN